MIVNIGQILTENVLQFKSLRVIYKDAPGPRITRPLRCIIMSYGLIWHFFRRSEMEKSKDRKSKFSMVINLPYLLIFLFLSWDFTFDIIFAAIDVWHCDSFGFYFLRLSLKTSFFGVNSFHSLFMKWFKLKTWDNIRLISKIF